METGGFNERGGGGAARRKEGVEVVSASCAGKASERKGLDTGGLRGGGGVRWNLRELQVTMQPPVLGEGGGGCWGARQRHKKGVRSGIQLSVQVALRHYNSATCIWS